MWDCKTILQTGRNLSLASMQIIQHPNSGVDDSKRHSFIGYKLEDCLLSAQVATEENVLGVYKVGHCLFHSIEVDNT